jgi:hypothetical protein
VAIAHRKTFWVPFKNSLRMIFMLPPDEFEQQAAFDTDVVAAEVVHIAAD